jgi:hypothetical protein
MRRFLFPVLAACISAAAVAAFSFAASDSSTRSSSSSGSGSGSGPPPTLAEVHKRFEQRRQQAIERIAKRLDVSADRLTDAMDEVMRDQLDADVKANRLTDAERDAILACKSAPLTCDRSNLPAPRFGRPHGSHDDFFEALAKKLGKDADDVRAAFAAERPERHGWGGPGHGPDGPRGYGHHGPGGFGGPGPDGFGGPGPGPGFAGP